MGARRASSASSGPASLQASKKKRAARPSAGVRSRALQPSSSIPVSDDDEPEDIINVDLGLDNSDSDDDDADLDPDLRI